MSITVFGMILLPISLWLAYRPIRLLQLALLVAAFEAAAALIFGNFGLQPAMVPGLLFVLYMVSQYAIGMRYPGEGGVLWAMLPLLLLLLYAVMSAWLLPDLFAGRVMVAPQKADPLAPDAFVPLQAGFGNVTQTLYLAFNVLLATVVAIFLTRARIPCESLIAAYLLSGYVVVALALWQFASRVAGLPFPDTLLHSNPGWAIVEQEVGSVPRIQGPFSEPAALAGYMSGIAFCSLWITLRGYRTMWPNVLFLLSLGTILLSTSTTGIVTVAVGLPFTFALALAGGGRAAVGRIGRTAGVLVLGGVMLGALIFATRPSLFDSVQTVVEATLSKGESESFQERSEWDAGALETLAPTYGLGVGWGSYRSSSLIPGLLANAGVFGIAMVIWLLLRLRRLRVQGRVVSRGHAGQILVDGFTAALCGQLAAAAVASPMITAPVFFLQLGCVVGILVRMVIEPRLSAGVTTAPASA
ncbi:conserved membrane protein of unknown function [Rhodovastum atsumiense]|uniref:O-antigen ligase domain-containing protein n=1 Tax=Rhodovastum atsumiense TaxID=504468 RepID=A0A5M6IW73_9PROT|nr:hypothetical protein [Rhodovastum atsumiense]KAA5612583.1 hypothetical protein F1189_09000 [Rhodovastum atsumiense]CAH2601321.1 conserved membrane protein of unknown function [Rhodovastum atsumiense]